MHPEGTKPIRGRLCAVRLPPDKAEEARARLRKEQGNKVSKESLEAAAFVVLFTTVPVARLSTERIFELYSLRWQVELHIKRDKSIAGLDRLPNFRPDTIYTWICTKLLITPDRSSHRHTRRRFSPRRIDITGRRLRHPAHGSGSPISKQLSSPNHGAS